MRITQPRLDHVAKLIDGALAGQYKAQGELKSEIRGAMGVEESHSTSDFPAVFRSITAAQFMGEYDQIESVYPQFTRQYNVNSLRPQAFYSLAQADITNLPDSNGGYDTTKNAPGGLPRVPELTEFPEITFQASENSFGVAKYGARVAFSFEMLLNDEWGVLETLPFELARLARNQEDIIATEVLAAPTGPNPTYFSNAHRNIFSVAYGFTVNNPKLSVDAVVEATSHVRGATFNGNPVTVGKFALMVPPALETEARRLLGVSSFQITDPVNGVYNVSNPLSDIQLIVNPWLTVIDKSANANKTWYVLPAGSQGVRPAVVFSKIRGREAPELRIANVGGEYLGGGAVPGREGSFLNDDIEFRVRHFVGAAGIAFETAVVSKGTAAA